MGSPARRATLALLLLGAPACRGCLVDDPTYVGGGGAGGTTTGDGTSTATGSTGTAPSSSSTGEGGAGSTTSTTSSTGGGDGGAGGSGSGGEDPGCPTSDDFESGLDPCWQVLNADDAGFAIVDGAVRLAPDAGTEWYGTSETTFYFQDVAGDFSAGVRVQANPAPGGTYHLAGLLLRDPTSGLEDWMASEVGHSEVANTQLYVVATVASASELLANESGVAESPILGVCRRGDTILLAARWGDDPWFPYSAVPLDPALNAAIPDFPPSLQVGFAAGAFTGDGFTASFDDFRVQLGGGEDDCLDVLEALWP